jgi:hypothetical protein
MSQRVVRCSACGAPFEIEVAGPFAGAEIAPAFCAACTDQQFLDQGGAVLTLRGELPGALFPLGKITVTAGAVAALAEASQHAVEFLMRHVKGDWGAVGHCDKTELTADEERRGWEATDDPAKINKWSLLNRRDRLMSEYATARGRRLWVITDLEGRSATTVLLPEEY